MQQNTENTITTERLFLKPLTYDQLIKYIKADNSLEDELDLNETLSEISSELKEALEQTILPNVADVNKNYLYSTLWTMILKDQKKMVGDLCFVGEPNKVGEIEIGYGTYVAFRRKGLMTEAVGAMIKWAENQPEVKSILAATEKNNIASSTILKKNNFVKVSETQTIYNWKLVIKG
jgi:ribosomal-protein-alanine N-acetyltransferase